MYPGLGNGLNLCLEWTTWEDLILISCTQGMTSRTTVDLTLPSIYEQTINHSCFLFTFFFLRALSPFPGVCHTELLVLQLRILLPHSSLPSALTTRHCSP